MEYHYAIIGAGSAGRTAAGTLAEEDPGSSILLVDAEPCLPYKRTQVSKNIAEGFENEAFAVHDDQWYRDRKISLHTGTAVASVDTDRRQLVLDGVAHTWGKLLLATGARPSIPFKGLPEEKYGRLWTKADAGRLRGDLIGRRRIAVVGNGVLGVEAAWQLSLMGREVVVIGSADYPMARYLDPVCSRDLSSAMEEAGVGLMSGKAVSGVRQDGNRLVLQTSDGEVEADYMVVTAGSSPDTDLARSAGLSVGKGIRVSGDLATSEPGIWAAGDCAEFPGGLVTGLWHSAEHQGRLAALSMIGRDVSFDNPPYRLKCEVFGGYWFSAGPVGAPTGPGFPEAAEDWLADGILWRPRFLDGRLAALSASAPRGMAKDIAKVAQKLLLDKADRQACRAVLGGV